MAVTQYQIFCRYLNENVSRALTNKTKVDWIGAEEYNDLKTYYTTNRAEYTNIVRMLTEVNYAYSLDNDLYRTAQDTVLRESQLTLPQQNIYEECKRYEYVQGKIEKDQLVVEQCLLEPADSTGNYAARAKRDLEHQSIIIKETNATNPKYDMVFMYDGIGYAESHTGRPDYANTTNKQIPYVYYDRMKRVKLDPWFLYSNHASLSSAMIKARELVNILGKEAVKIGKVVPLDQYIEIV